MWTHHLRRTTMLAARKQNDVPIFGHSTHKGGEFRCEVIRDNQVIFDDDARLTAGLSLLEQSHMRQVASDGALLHPSGSLTSKLQTMAIEGLKPARMNDGNPRKLLARMLHAIGSSIEINDPPLETLEDVAH